MSKTDEFVTIPAIAQRSGFPIHRVEYAVQSRGIKPVGKLGNARIFHERQIPQIVEAVKDASREPVEANG